MDTETYYKIMGILRWFDKHNDNLTDEQREYLAELKQLIIGD